jgi:hypothetical protein
LTLKLAINGHKAAFATVTELRRLLAPYAGEAFREVWVEAANGPALTVLFNGTNGFLMYLRENGDAGFTSRNPSYEGELNAKLSSSSKVAKRTNIPRTGSYPRLSSARPWSISSSIVTKLRFCNGTMIAPEWLATPLVPGI